MSAYLTWDSANNSTLYLVWSKNPVPNAAIKATPQEKVPEYKFGGGGKSEIIRDANDFVRFSLGVTTFFKLIYAYKCICELQSGCLVHKSLIVFHDNQNNVIKFSPTVKIDLKDQRRVACVKEKSDVYNVKTLHPEIFMAKAITTSAQTF